MQICKFFLSISNQENRFPTKLNPAPVCRYTVLYLGISMQYILYLHSILVGIVSVKASHSWLHPL